MIIFYRDSITKELLVTQKDANYIPNINEQIELVNLGYIYTGFVENKTIHIAREATNITIYMWVNDKKGI